VPCAIGEFHVLRQGAVAPDDQVRGHAQEAICAKYGCTSAGNVLVNSRSIHGPPNSLGGQADAVHDDQIGFDPGGRESQFGEAMYVAPRISALSEVYLQMPILE
jgi:hypothetical protein